MVLLILLVKVIYQLICRIKISELEILENGDSRKGSTSQAIVEQKLGTFMVISSDFVSGSLHGSFLVLSNFMCWYNHIQPEL